MASAWSSTYHSERDLYLTTPLLDQYTIKLITLLASLTASTTEDSREEMEKKPAGFLPRG